MTTAFAVWHSAAFYVIAAAFGFICLPIADTLAQFSIAMASGGLSAFIASCFALYAIR